MVTVAQVQKQLLASGFAFARSGPAWDENGVMYADGVPRIVPGKGLLVEGARTNFALHSNCKTGFPYNPLGGTLTDQGIDNGVAAPDGTTGARRITLPPTVGIRFGATSGGTPGTTYCGSVWLRTTDGSTKSIVADVNDQATATFTVTPTWQRFWQTGTDAVNAYRFFDLQAPVLADLHVWGVQIEAGAFPSSPIVTTSAAVTRAAESLLAARAAAELAQGTVVCELTAAGGGMGLGLANQVAYQAYASGASHNVTILRQASDSGLWLQSWNTSAFDAALNTGALANGATAKLAIRWATNNFAACTNGGPILADTTGTPGSPALDGERLGTDATNAWFGYLRRLRRLPYPVSDAQLQALAA